MKKVGSEIRGLFALPSARTTNHHLAGSVNSNVDDLAFTSVTSLPGGELAATAEVRVTAKLGALPKPPLADCVVIFNVLVEDPATGEWQVASTFSPATADFDVAALFAAEESYKWDNAGGNAYQVPEDNPAHIFRKNPSDRSNETSSTAKDDYFLEDPYEKVNADSAQDGGSDVYEFSLTGVDGESGPDSNGKVFFIDGNLWLHNKKSYSIGLNHKEADGVQITFVVKGNIYFSDNFFYSDEDDDGVVFIAMEDENVADSGNIFLGDPEFGTLKRMNAFMYAENDFYDYNLDASGSARVEIYGNMSAGNQVLIERDYHGSHTKLTVDFDERLEDGSLELPMLPVGSGIEPSAFVVQAWWPCETEVTEDVAGAVAAGGDYAQGVSVD